MPSSLAAVALQIADKVCQLITGPVVGTITTTATVGEVEVPIGQMATIGGRRVRVIKRTPVTTTPTLVPVRLEWLAPSMPNANNFAAVAAGTVATWVAPPANLVATGTTSQLGPGSLAGALKIGAFVEHDSDDGPADTFAAGATGTATLCLFSPSVERIGSENFVMTGLYEATWGLRLALNDVGQQKERRTRARDAFDAIVAALHGAAAGDDVIRVRRFRPVKKPGWNQAWDLDLLTRVEIDGLPLREANPDFVDADIIVKIPGDADQPSPHRVLERAETT